jgi:acetamidase/formamidase
MRGREEGDRAADGVREACALCRVAVDLRIHEVVDAPNRVVGVFLPDDIFVGGGGR